MSADTLDRDMQEIERDIWCQEYFYPKWGISDVRWILQTLAEWCDKQADAPLRSNVHVSRMEWRDLADQLWKVVGE